MKQRAVLARPRGTRPTRRRRVSPAAARRARDVPREGHRTGPGLADAGRFLSESAARKKSAAERRPRDVVRTRRKNRPPPEGPRPRVRVVRSRVFFGAARRRGRGRGREAPRRRQRVRPGGRVRRLRVPRVRPRLPPRVRVRVRVPLRRRRRGGAVLPARPPRLSGRILASIFSSVPRRLSRPSTIARARLASSNASGREHKNTTHVDRESRRGPPPPRRVGRPAPLPLSAAAARPALFPRTRRRRSDASSPRESPPRSPRRRSGWWYRFRSTRRTGNTTPPGFSRRGTSGRSSRRWS